MDTAHSHTPPKTLTVIWLVLLVLTLISLLLGEWLHGAAGLPLLVAGIIWLKGWLIIEHFIEAATARTYIRRLNRCFVAFAPLALLLTVFFGQQIASWLTLPHP